MPPAAGPPIPLTASNALESSRPRSKTQGREASTTSSPSPPTARLRALPLAPPHHGRSPFNTACSQSSTPTCSWSCRLRQRHAGRAYYRAALSCPKAHRNPTNHLGKVLPCYPRPGSLVLDCLNSTANQRHHFIPRMSLPDDDPNIPISPEFQPPPALYSPQICKKSPCIYRSGVM
ncbi:hypothetical protein DFP72DRAFT_910209 [Ephemerocybe angulata]|uniref:Uncharacterized protein n=1 Tax=Ephemerocybe angulata TaxID=980116 RepID=A0A8H6HQI8_9AGAR|nr:hypothetical protein DFP72DRAFT_910209 [Tulosesus angulatus]